MNRFFKSTVDKEKLNPDTLPNQVVIWDISDASTLTIDGSGWLQQCNDKSGNANHSIPSASQRPLYFATGGPNNNPFIKTTAVNKFFGKASALTGLATSPMVVYAVIRFPALFTSTIKVFVFNGSSGASLQTLASDGGSAESNSGVAPFYSKRNTLINRTE